MTNGWTDVANADVILIMGGNPAENHPVGFRFAIEAKRARKARLVTVDPRFNRTAAVSDCYVPIRAGSDIAFLGGLIHYILTHNLYQRDYVALHTNASFLIQDSFYSKTASLRLERREEELRQIELGLPARRRGVAKVDPALEHPRSVFQLMKQHYARYTPEVVANICGCSVEDFEKAAAIICSTGRPDRQGTILYALGWTQHSHSVQLIHTAAMLQLLGNIGVPGGGVMPAGSLEYPRSDRHGSLEYASGYLRAPAPIRNRSRSISRKHARPLRPNSMNYLANAPKFMTSLLKAYYGDAATRENGFGYNYLPKLGETDIIPGVTFSTACMPARFKA